MKWAILTNSYSIKVVEAEDAEGAAKEYLREKNESGITPGPGKSKGGKVKSRRPRVSAVSVIDIEAGKIREFELAPPPPPPIEEWKVTEIPDGDEDDDEEETDYDDGRV